MSEQRSGEGAGSDRNPAAGGSVGRGAFRGKGGLGRGLGALIPDADPRIEENSAAPGGRLHTAAPHSGSGQTGTVEGTTSGARPAPTTIDIDLISPNPHQPRGTIDPGQLEALSDSIRQHGLLQPLLVSRQRSESGGISYQLIAGERRWHAARAAGLERVPVVIREATPQQQLELALVENIQRADLNPLEEALAFQRLATEFGLTQAALAQRVGRGRVAVANTLRLLALSDAIKQSLAAGVISEGHARALLGLADAETRQQLWQQVCERGLSVRETETLVRTLRERPAAGAEQPVETAARPAVRARQDPDLAALVERLQGSLGTAVQIRRGGGRRGGTLVINFYSDEELNVLAERLLGDEF